MVDAMGMHMQRYYVCICFINEDAGRCELLCAFDRINGKTRRLHTMCPRWTPTILSSAGYSYLLQAINITKPYISNFDSQSGVTCHAGQARGGFNHCDSICDSICSVAGGGNDDALEGFSLLSANAMASEHIFAPRDCDAVLYLVMQEFFSRRRGWQAFSAFFGSLASVSVPS